VGDEDCLPRVDYSRIVADELGYEAVPSEEEDEAEGDHYARHDERNRQDCPDDPFAGEVVVGEDVRSRQTEEERQNRRGYRLLDCERYNGGSCSPEQPIRTLGLGRSPRGPS